jgi:hypothetical protein
VQNLAASLAPARTSPLSIRYSSARLVLRFLFFGALNFSGVLAAIAAEIVKLWPDDAAARNQNDYLRLLLGASGEAAEAVERQAQILVAQEPLNWSARATLGLARLRLGRNADALAVATSGQQALSLRCARSSRGHPGGERLRRRRAGDAHNLRAEHLLPEERALIAPLLGGVSDQ